MKMLTSAGMVPLMLAIPSFAFAEETGGVSS
jgi:hypothetical protein